jgi:hypothetical protein
MSAAARQRINMVYLKFSSLLTFGASALLALASCVNVGGRDDTLGSSDPSAASLPRHALDGSKRFGVILCPLGRCPAVACRILGAAFSRPLGTDPGALGVVSLVATGQAPHADAAGRKAQVMPVLARYASRIVQQLSLARYDSGWMLRLLGLRLQRVLDSAGGAQSAARVALGNVPILARQPREIKPLARRLSGQPLRDWFAHLIALTVVDDLYSIAAPAEGS